MTSRHDDAIEVLSVSAERGGRYLELGTPQDDNLRVLPPGAEPPTERQKRIARIVMVIATLMLVSSVLLVTVTLSMSDHIDEMVESEGLTSPSLELSSSPVRKVNGLGTTLPPVPPQPTPPSTTMKMVIPPTNSSAPDTKYTATP